MNEDDIASELDALEELVYRAREAQRLLSEYATNGRSADVLERFYRVRKLMKEFVNGS